MKSIPRTEKTPPGVLEVFVRGDEKLLIESEKDYASVPPDISAILDLRAAADAEQSMLQTFAAQADAQKEAEYEAFKARSGQPSYKAAAVKIAAEKLGMLDTIETAIMATVDKMGDKALYVWWNETDAISRGDANWQQIEAAVPWGKVSAADVFELAAQV